MVSFWTTDRGTTAPEVSWSSDEATFKESNNSSDKRRAREIAKRGKVQRIKDWAASKSEVLCSEISAGCSARRPSKASEQSFSGRVSHFFNPCVDDSLAARRLRPDVVYTGKSFIESGHEYDPSILEISKPSQGPDVLLYRFGQQQKANGLAEIKRKGVDLNVRDLCTVATEAQGGYDMDEGSVWSWMAKSAASGAKSALGWTANTGLSALTSVASFAYSYWTADLSAATSDTPTSTPEGHVPPTSTLEKSSVPPSDKTSQPTDDTVKTSNAATSCRKYQPNKGRTVQEEYDAFNKATDSCFHHHDHSADTSHYKSHQESMQRQYASALLSQCTSLYSTQVKIDSNLAPRAKGRQLPERLRKMSIDASRLNEYADWLSKQSGFTSGKWSEKDE